MILATAFVLGCAPSPAGRRGEEAAIEIQRTWCAMGTSGDCDALETFDRCMTNPIFLGAGRRVDEGRGRLDEALLAQCLDSVSCDFFAAVCFRVFEGLGEEGASCDYDQACRRELHCERAGSACGHCARDVDLGMPCSGEGWCVGHVGFFEAGPACVRTGFETGVCGIRDVETVSVGEACGDVILASRTISRRCDADALCVQGMCVAAPLAEGTACTRGVPCGEGLACQDGVCAPASSMGEPCVSSGAEGPVCDSRQALSCIGGLCLPEPDELGDACIRTCAGGLRCLDLVCRHPSPVGGGCWSDADCAEGTCGFDLRCGSPAC